MDNYISKPIHLDLLYQTILQTIKYF